MPERTAGHSQGEQISGRDFVRFAQKDMCPSAISHNFAI